MCPPPLLYRPAVVVVVACMGLMNAVFCSFWPVSSTSAGIRRRQVRLIETCQHQGCGQVVQETLTGWEQRLCRAWRPLRSRPRPYCRTTTMPKPDADANPCNGRPRATAPSGSNLERRHTPTDTQRHDWLTRNRRPRCAASHPLWCSVFSRNTHPPPTTHTTPHPPTPLTPHTHTSPSLSWQRRHGDAADLRARSCGTDSAEEAEAEAEKAIFSDASDAEFDAPSTPQRPHRRADGDGDSADPEHPGDHVDGDGKVGGGAGGAGETGRRGGCLR